MGLRHVAADDRLADACRAPWRSIIMNDRLRRRTAMLLSFALLCPAMTQAQMHHHAASKDSTSHHAATPTHEHGTTSAPHAHATTSQAGMHGMDMSGMDMG